MLGAIGYDKLESRPHTVGFGKKYPEFWINLRATMSPVARERLACGAARATELVDAFHAAALAAGGMSDGAPACARNTARLLRRLHPRPDGNRIEAVMFRRRKSDPSYSAQGGP